MFIYLICVSEYSTHWQSLTSSTFSGVGECKYFLGVTFE